MARHDYLKRRLTRSELYSLERRLTRSERNHLDVDAFIYSDADSMKMILYSSEISRLIKDFPQITIAKGDVYKNHLYICTVTKK